MVTASEVFAVVRAVREGVILVEDLILLSELQDFTMADADAVIDHVSEQIIENMNNNERT